MKVLAVIIAHPLRKRAGATNAGRELSIATADLVEMDLAIMWDQDETLRLGNLNVRHVRSTSVLDFAAPVVPRFARVPLFDSRIPELIRDGDYDLVHIHNLVPAFAAERVARACVRRGIPYVISSHGFYELTHYARINQFNRLKTLLADVAITRPFRRVVKGATCIFTLSNCERELLTALGVADDRIHVVTNGVSEFFFAPPLESELADARRKFGIDTARGPLLFFMGSLHAYKGVDIFLKSLASVQQPFQAIVGGAFKSDAERTRLLGNAGLKADVEALVRFTSALSNEELRALYHLADLFVYPTQGDTLPLVVLEAMACGLPVVSTTVAGIPYAVTPDVGILVPPGDARAAAAAVNTLLSDPDKQQTMGTAAAARVRQEFRWSVSARCAVEGYNRCLGGAGTAKNEQHVSGGGGTPVSTYTSLRQPFSHTAFRGPAPHR